MDFRVPREVLGDVPSADFLRRLITQGVTDAFASIARQIMGVRAMSETEWLSCEDPHQMLDWLTADSVLAGGPGTSDRKLRLFSVALAEAYHRRGGSDPATIDEWVCEALAWIDGTGPAPEGTPGLSGKLVRWLLYDETAPESARQAIGSFCKGGQRAARWVTPAGISESRRRLPRADVAALLRDIVGNPFAPPRRPIYCQTAARAFDVDVLQIAAEAYHFRDAGRLEPDRLAILADALEECLCVQADLLAHLRSPGPHVRGCWALDLVLGKE